MKQRLLLFLFATLIFLAGIVIAADPGSAPAKDFNIPNWAVWLLSVGWAVLYGISIAYIKLKVSTLQTKEGCANERKTCKAERLDPMNEKDSDRKLRLEGFSSDLEHLSELFTRFENNQSQLFARLEKSQEKQGDQLAQQARVLILIGARFGVDVTELQ